MTGLSFTIIDHGSSAYKACLGLREEILRKPLGLTFSPLDLEAEKDHIHIAGWMGDRVVATAALVSKGEACKMQRVAVRTDLQSSGIGSALLEFCEVQAKRQGFTTMYCHARETAVPFYVKNGYHLEGECFEEQTLPHIKMWKNL